MDYSHPLIPNQLLRPMERSGPDSSPDSNPRALPHPKVFRLPIQEGSSLEFPVPMVLLPRFPFGYQEFGKDAERLWS